MVHFSNKNSLAHHKASVRQSSLPQPLLLNPPPEYVFPWNHSPCKRHAYKCYLSPEGRFHSHDPTLLRVDVAHERLGSHVKQWYVSDGVHIEGVSRY